MLQHLTAKNHLSIKNFTLEDAGEFGYIVTFFSPKTNKPYICKTINSKLIKSIFKAQNPKQKDLITLKKLCKHEKTI